MTLTNAISAPLSGTLESAGALSQMRAANSTAQLRPLMLIVETINVCNSACVFCPYTIQTRPKGVMTETVFARVLEEYAAMGGGAVSLTPMVGDVLLDRKLPSRIAELRRHQVALRPSLTTNLYALERWPDDVVIDLLNVCQRVYVSIYGITAEENRAITQHDHHETLCAQMRRLLRLKAESEATAEIGVGFRTLRDYTAAELAAFQQREFGTVFTRAGTTASYCNWGNSMRGALPGSARWVAERENTTACLLLATALQVFHDGRVSACACCDFDASPELTLGSLADHTLLELFNGEKNQQLWRDHQANRLPAYCRNCTFHVPLQALTARHPVVTNITDFIGG